MKKNRGPVGMNGMTIGAATASALAMAGVAFAQPVIDGENLTSEYGSPLWVNDVNPTQFGDNDDPDAGCANGSEIDAIYAIIDDNAFGEPTLFIAVAGNLETNFNKLEVFFDYNFGVGQNKLRGDNPDIDFDGLNRMGDDGSGNGLTFDDDFTVNAWFGMTNGNCTGPDAEVFANFADLDLQEAWFLGEGSIGFGNLSGGDNPFGIAATNNNSNVDGVTDSEASGGESVDTGMEIAIPLAAFGDPEQDIKMTIFVNGSGHDFMSNQISGGSPDNPLENLGEPREVDLGAISGKQFVTVENGGIPGDCLTLAVQNLVAGERAQFNISNGTPGVRAVTVHGFRPGSTRVVDVAGYCATFGIRGVNQSSVIGGLNQSFDNNGEISFSLPIPTNAQGRAVLFQSAERGTCPDECMSNLVEQVVQ